MRNRASQPTVLAPCDFYLPGLRCGGVSRSIANTIERLGGELDFRIVTRDHDDGVPEPYDSVRYGVWERRGPAHVRYLARSELAPRTLTRCLRSISHDTLYLNSVFSRPFSIWPLLLRRVGLMPRRRLVIAPNGELADPALASKPIRKRAFIALARLLRLHADATWRTSSPQEAQAVRRRLGRSARVEIAANLVPPLEEKLPVRPPKQRGGLRIAYLGRIVPLKNLHGALGALAGVSGKVHLDVYGPRCDGAYWRHCEERIASLPGGVDATYQGLLEPEETGAVLSRYDLLVLLSRAESFGYAVAEALAAGCPVLVSDSTPWRDLAVRGAGWDVPIDDVAAQRRAIQQVIQMDEAEHRRWREGARAALSLLADDPDVLEQHRRLLGAPRTVATRP